MKKIITLFALIFSSICFGQNNYSEIDAIVKSAIDSYSKETEELKFLKIVKNKFDKSGNSAKMISKKTMWELRL